MVLFRRRNRLYVREAGVKGNRRGATRHDGDNCAAPLLIFDPGFNFVNLGSEVCELGRHFFAVAGRESSLGVTRSIGSESLDHNLVTRRGSMFVTTHWYACALYTVLAVCALTTPTQMTGEQHKLDGTVGTQRDAGPATQSRQELYFVNSATGRIHALRSSLESESAGAVGWLIPKSQVLSILSLMGVMFDERAVPVERLEAFEAHLRILTQSEGGSVCCSCCDDTVSPCVCDWGCLKTCYPFHAP